MKCIASFVILALTCVASVLARKQVGRPNIGGYIYACYDDNRATLIGTTKTSASQYKIPAYVTYQGKDYRVTIVQANGFKGVKIPKISVDPANTALLLKHNAFNGIVGLKEFNIDSKKVEPEIGAFNGVGTDVLFQGVGTVDALDKLIVRYLKKWKLQIGKDYTNVSETDKMKDLYALALNMKKNFINDNVGAYPDRPASVAFIGHGARGGHARLFRNMALTMGFRSEDVLVGCDTMTYCWNYIKINNNSGGKKYHVLDISDGINEYVNLDTSVFQKENNFINNTLTRFYKNYYTIDAHTFNVHFNMWFYKDEPMYQTVYNFDTWIKDNKAVKRTL